MGRQTTKRKSKFPVSRGRVLLSRVGQFYGQNETLNPEPTTQLSQFLPRVEWPAVSKAERDGNPCMWDDMTQPPLERSEANVSQTQLDLRTWWAAQNNDLVPMPPYQHATNNFHGPSRQCYGDSIWEDHAMVLNHCLKQTISNREWLLDDHILELLTCASYGMHQSMTWLRPFVLSNEMVKDEDGGSQVFKKHVDNDYDFQTPTVRGTIQDKVMFGDYQFREAMLQRMLGRRWIAVPMNQGVNHWFMTLFDRQEGQLYIFDAFRTSRSERIKAAVDMWAKFWKDMEMPWHFQYFVAPASYQPNNWGCGLLAVASVVDSLRNRVGGDYVRGTDDTVQTDTDINLYNNVVNDYPPQDSSLRLRDWLPEGCDSAFNGFAAVQHMFEVMIANELGLQNHHSMTKDNRHSAAEKLAGAQRQTPWSRLERIIKLWKRKTTVAKSKGGTHAKDAKKSMTLEIDDFYTDFGGLQFAVPAKMTARPYVERPDRTYNPGKDTLNGDINFCPKFLNAEPTQDISNIDYSPKYAPEKPTFGTLHLKGPTSQVQQQLKEILNGWSNTMSSGQTAGLNGESSAKANDCAELAVTLQGQEALIDCLKNALVTAQHKMSTGGQAQDSDPLIMHASPVTGQDNGQIDISSAAEPSGIQQDHTQQGGTQQLSSQSQQDQAQQETFDKVKELQQEARDESAQQSTIEQTATQQRAEGRTLDLAGTKRRHTEVDDGEGESDAQKAKRARERGGFWKKKDSK